MPKLSIITITYNAEKVLRKTILSIINQTFTDYEYLIIDGGSKDKTLEIVSEFKDKVNYVISEPDRGLYDAMNKGLLAAKGEYVWFMNAGDEIFDNHTASTIFKSEADVFYGNALFINEDGTESGLRDHVTPHLLPEKLTWKSMKYGMVVCHQAFIAKRSIAPLYELHHPYSADIDWEIKCLKNAKLIENTQLTLCKYLTGGFSKKNLYRSLKDRYLILKKHFGFFSTIFSHIWIVVRGVLFVLKRKKSY